MAGYIGESFPENEIDFTFDGAGQIQLLGLAFQDNIQAHAVAQESCFLAQFFHQRTGDERFARLTGEKLADFFHRIPREISQSTQFVDQVFGRITKTPTAAFQAKNESGERLENAVMDLE